VTVPKSRIDTPAGEFVANETVPDDVWSVMRAVAAMLGAFEGLRDGDEVCAFTETGTSGLSSMNTTTTRTAERSHMFILGLGRCDEVVSGWTPS